MSSIGGLNIIRNGLVLALDAGNVKSYSGSNWKDLSENKYIGNIIGGITGDNSGIVFNGIDSMIGLGISPTQLGIYDNSYTAECVCYPTNLSGDKGMFGGGEGGGRQGMHLVFRDGTIYLGHYGSDYGAGSVAVNNWYHIVFRFNKTNGEACIFKNGIKQGTGSIQSFIGNGNMFIGASLGGSAPFQGKILLSGMYDRALPDGEMLQNYNTLKSKFKFI